MAAKVIINLFFGARSDSNHSKTDEFNDNISESAWSEISLPSSVLSLHSNDIVQSPQHYEVRTVFANQKNDSNNHVEEPILQTQSSDSSSNAMSQFSYAEITKIQPMFTNENDINNNNKQQSTAISNKKKLKIKDDGYVTISKSNAILPESNPCCTKSDLGRNVNKRRSNTKWSNNKHFKNNKNKAKKSKK